MRTTQGCYSYRTSKRTLMGPQEATLNCLSQHYRSQASHQPLNMSAAVFFVFFNGNVINQSLGAVSTIGHVGRKNVLMGRIARAQTFRNHKCPFMSPSFYPFPTIVKLCLWVISQNSWLQKDLIWLYDILFEVLSRPFCVIKLLL